ncbi:glucose 1-dehydrogenase [Streptomyces misionensis]|uniref:glucose 1-dehydrogenase n=1 Tax=Streptomyces misionensis TaxID=67331 RepID=UPI0033CA7886
MRALTVSPENPHDLRIEDLKEPQPGPDQLLVNGLAVGVCATDREILAGQHGTAPPGASRLVLGHESLGRVRTAPEDSGFSVGDLVVGVVRRPDPEPCAACANGEFDMCRNGLYTERGIKELDGFAAESWIVEPSFCVRIDESLGHLGVLLEPTSVVAKAWEQVYAVGRRSWFEPASVLVTGAGPVGVLAALLGMQQGLDVHVLDQETVGPKPALVEGLGATYHYGDVQKVVSKVRPDVIIEATGAPTVLAATLEVTTPYRVTCLMGLPVGGGTAPTSLASAIRDTVLGNCVVVGSINANLRHYHAGAKALAAADPSWLNGIITRRVPLSDAQDAFRPRPHDIKVVIDLNEGR